MRKISKFLLVILLAGMVLQVGFTAFALVSGGLEEQSSVPESESIDRIITEKDIIISQAVLDQIKASDPDNYDNNVSNYTRLLVSLHVDDTYKQEIERLILEGNSLPDILISYEFLYERFGLISELESLVLLRNANTTWETIFTEYNDSHLLFIPRTFESGYLETLSNTPSITSDDIMIADRVSHVTGKAFEEVIGAKIDVDHWKPITVNEGVLYSADTLPTVQITIEQIEKYVGQNGLTEDQVVEALVLAHKTGLEAKTVIDRAKNGDSEEAIWADRYSDIYE